MPFAHSRFLILQKNEINFKHNLFEFASVALENKRVFVFVIGTLSQQESLNERRHTTGVSVSRGAISPMLVREAGKPAIPAKQACARRLRGCVEKLRRKFAEIPSERIDISRMP